MADVAAKRIVCLANSRKEGDRCIAGRMHYRILLNRLSRSGLMATTRITGGTIGCRLTPPSRWIVRYDLYALARWSSTCLHPG